MYCCHHTIHVIRDGTGAEDGGQNEQNGNKLNTRDGNAGRDRKNTHHTTPHHSTLTGGKIKEGLVAELARRKQLVLLYHGINHNIIQYGITAYVCIVCVVGAFPSTIARIMRSSYCIVHKASKGGRQHQSYLSKGKVAFLPVGWPAHTPPPFSLPRSYGAMYCIENPKVQQ